MDIIAVSVLLMLLYGHNVSISARDTPKHKNSHVENFFSKENVC